MYALQIANNHIIYWFGTKASYLYSKLTNSCNEQLIVLETILLSLYSIVSPAIRYRGYMHMR